MSNVIENKKVAIIHFTLIDESETIMDTTTDGEPMPYLHGAGNIVPGLENALTGKAKGDKVNVTLQPEDGYGEASGIPEQKVPRTQFEPGMQIEEGMQFITEGEMGLTPVWVTRTTDTDIYVTFDHPLAGRTLTFDVEVIDVRDANADEIEHGHAHGMTGGEGHHH